MHRKAGLAKHHGAASLRNGGRQFKPVVSKPRIRVVVEVGNRALSIPLSTSSAMPVGIGV